MRRAIPISNDFFCDGHCYLLTSASFGGSGLTAQQIEEILFAEDKDRTTELLLKKGVCFPVCFPGDCALDNAALFVLGDLTPEEERDWMARLRWKLNIPCGRLILCCGCLAEDLEPAVAGEAPDPHYEIYQTIEVPPDEYLVEIYAYFHSQTMQVALDDESDEYHARHDGAAYIIRLTPLETEPPLPETASGWLENFEFRHAENFGK
jgi:hypothetical protein